MACSKPTEVLLYLDPVHQIHNNENDYCWQPIGLNGTKKVLANTGRRRLNIIGAINPVTFEPTIMLTEEKLLCRSNRSLLGEIKKQYSHAASICIILDNARYQRSYLVQQKSQELGLELLYLSPYSSNLNLIERLWRYFKKKIMKNRFYENYARFENAVETFFQTFDNNSNELKSLLHLKFGIIKAD